MTSFYQPILKDWALSLVKMEEKFCNTRAPTYGLRDFYELKCCQALWCYHKLVISGLVSCFVQVSAQLGRVSINSLLGS